MKDLLLLHGALGTSTLFDPLVKALDKRFNVHRFNFSGHGDQPMNDAGFGIEFFAQELAQYMADHGLKQVPVFGYSMGGYVALYLESAKPGIFSQIVTLGTKFDWNPVAALHETSRMVPEAIEAKVPKFAAVLGARHKDWKGLMKATADMMIGLGNQPLLNEQTLAEIGTSTTIMWGEQDNMVSKEESELSAQSLANGGFKVLPNCPHPIEKVDATTLSEVLITLF